MDLPCPQFSTWLIPWPWWVVIGLAAGLGLLLGLSILAITKEADSNLEAYAREHKRERRLADRAKRNGIGRP